MAESRSARIDYEDFDESSVRVRPNPRGTRPRTKKRPAHEDAASALVVGVDRGRYRVVVDGTAVTASRARELRDDSIVVGDRVDVVGDVSGAPGSLGRIVRIGERSTVLRRSADDTDTVERVIVANADQMMIVVAAANPEPRPRLIDRYLVAAYDAGIAPLLCVTKTDLADPSRLLEAIAGAGVPVVTTGIDAPGVDGIVPLLDGRFTVLVGHSGVGKSTLINALVPGADRATSHVNAVTGRGRHTSSSAVAFPLGGRDGAAEEESAAEERGARHGWIVDTPGVRSFGLGHVSQDNLVAAFPELAEIAATCPRGCTHLPDSPDCAMIEAVADGRLDATAAARLDSLQRLIAALSPG